MLDLLVVIIFAAAIFVILNKIFNFFERCYNLTDYPYPHQNTINSKIDSKKQNQFSIDEKLSIAKQTTNLDCQLKIESFGEKATILEQESIKPNNLNSKISKEKSSERAQEIEKTQEFIEKKPIKQDKVQKLTVPEEDDESKSVKTCTINHQNQQNLIAQLRNQCRSLSSQLQFLYAQNDEQRQMVQNLNQKNNYLQKICQQRQMQSQEERKIEQLLNIIEEQRNLKQKLLSEKNIYFEKANSLEVEAVKMLELKKIDQQKINKLEDHIKDMLKSQQKSEIKCKTEQNIAQALPSGEDNKLCKDLIQKQYQISILKGQILQLKQTYEEDALSKLQESQNLRLEELAKVKQESIQQRKIQISVVKNQYQNIVLKLHQEIQNASRIRLDLQSQLDFKINAQSQIKNQLEFCQSQLKEAFESQDRNRQVIKRLEAKIYEQEHQRSQIYSNPEYLKLKQQVEQLSQFANNGKSQNYREEATFRAFDRKNDNHDEQKSIRSNQDYQRKRVPSSAIYQASNLTPRGSDYDYSINNNIGERSISMIEPGEFAQTANTTFLECGFLSQGNKVFIASEIKKIKKINIKKTKQLYKLDKMHPQNPHEYIDNIPNIFLVAELANNKIIGAFSQLAFSQEDMNESQRKKIIANRAMLLDLTNKKVIHNSCKENTIVYDEKALIWGRNEFIIKNEEPTILYCNFTPNHNVYWDTSNHHDQFLGSKRPWEKINRYEIYRIYLG